MSPAPITPQDLLAIGALGVVVGFALDRALLHLCALIRARRLQSLIRRSTLFRFRP